jgi:hypothetical protein
LRAQIGYRDYARCLPGYLSSLAGDNLSVDEVKNLAAEIHALQRVHAARKEQENVLRHFELQMDQLVEAALRVRKPIAF